MQPIKYLSKDNTKFQKGRHYIGASNMPTLYGLTKQYGSTPLTLWEELTGRAEGFKGNRLTAWGNKQESMILAEYVRLHTPLNSDDFMISRLKGQYNFHELHSLTKAHREDYPFCVAHADLLDNRDLDNPILIQAKNTGFFASSRKEDKNKGYDKEDHSQNGIPLSVYLQEQWEMYCYEVNTAYVAVLIGGNDWQLYGPIEYNKKVVENSLALAKRLWEHVENDTPPKPETWPDVCKLFPEMKEDEATTIGGKDYEDMVSMREELREINYKMNKLEARKEDIINATGLLIGGNGVLRGVDGEELAKVSIRPGRETISVKDVKYYDIETYDKLVDDGIIKTSKPWRGITVKGGTISGSHKCKQCGGDAINGVTKKDGRKIVYGPFCKSCYDKIKGDSQQ